MARDDFSRWAPLPAGVVRAEFRRDPVWELAARRAIKHVLRTQPVFTEDDVWRRLRAQGVPPPVEPRWMPALLRQAGRAGACTRRLDDVGEVWLSNRYEKAPEL